MAPPGGMHGASRPEDRKRSILLRLAVLLPVKPPEEPAAVSSASPAEDAKVDARKLLIVT